MYIDNNIKKIIIENWTEIVTHEYERISRTKWRIHLIYVCGAEMYLEDQPDDLIQCLVVGAVNSKKPITLNSGELSINVKEVREPISEWRDLKQLIVDTEDLSQ